MPKNTIAVDIVLIPETSLFERALSINAELVKTQQSEIVLHPTDCLPHISLTMGAIDQDDIPRIAQALQALWQESPLDGLLGINGLVYRTHGQKTVSSIELTKTEDLQGFHEKVMACMAPFFHYDITPAMFTGKGPISDSSIGWVSTFRDKAGGEHFWPHITLGYGKADPVDIQDTFRADSLKLCQLGNHCTCQKVLASTA